MIRIFVYTTLFLIWSVAAAILHSPIFPGPTQTVRDLFALVGSGDAWHHIFITFGRVVSGVSIALLLSLVAGLYSAYSKKIGDVVSPLVAILQASPAIVWISLLLIWVGSGAAIVIVSIVVGTLPILYFCALHGVASVREDLGELREIYNIPRLAYAQKILIPSMASHICVGLRNALGISWKLAATAEFLASRDGVGAKLYDAYRLLEIEQLFSWSILLIAIGVGLEHCVSWVLDEFGYTPRAGVRTGKMRGREKTRGLRSPHARIDRCEKQVACDLDASCNDKPARHNIIFKLKDVGIAYKEAVILSGISLELHQGEMLNIIGPSGIGKSSLLHLLAGLLGPESGEVEHATCGIGYAFQRANIIPWISAMENMEIALRGKFDPSQANHLSEYWLGIFGLRDSMHCLGANLSAGMSARLNLARSFASEPKLILLDEPFAFLDASNRDKLEGVIEEVQARGDVAIVIASHEPLLRFRNNCEVYDLSTRTTVL